jgi:GTP-binding protein Era
VLFVINGEEGVGPGDRWIAELLGKLDVPKVVAVNKVDRLSKARTAEVLLEAASLGVGDEIFPVAAKTGAGVGPLLTALHGLLAPGPFFFPPEAPTDQPLEVLLAELVREEVLKRTFQEVPHAVEVVVEELDLGARDDLAVVVARIWVEADSQKGILIGKGGKMIKTVGTAARRALERELGTQVHLELQVDVRRRWRADERALDRLGIE